MTAEPVTTEPGGDTGARRILDAARRLLPGEEVVLLHRGPARRRSSLYFLGPPGGPCHWVVKQPHVRVAQADLTSPRTAAEQYDALVRLDAHLRATGSRVTTTRPLALLPELGAHLMEFVPGPTVVDLIGPGALTRPGRLWAAVDDAAEVLRAVHALDARAGEVLLHGDFAPENVVLTPAGPCCLDPDLCERGPAEHDVVRFLVMFADAPFFVVAGRLPRVRGVRRRAVRRFLTAYYDGSTPPPSLGPLLEAALAARWQTRHTDLLARRPRGRRTRLRLVRRHFEAVLAEVSSPTWPD